MSQPLEGIRVLDLTQVMLGPCATQLLGDFGADVIKIERPGQGDLSRWSVPDPAGLDNPVFVSLNRNKRSIALNLKSPKAREVVRALVKEGLCPKPQHPHYLLAMIGRLGYDARSGREMAAALRADSTLLEVEVWELFELDNSGESGLANGPGWAAQPTLDRRPCSRPSA